MCRCTLRLVLLMCWGDYFAQLVALGLVLGLVAKYWQQRCTLHCAKAERQATMSGWPCCPIGVGKATVAKRRTHRVYRADLSLPLPLPISLPLPLPLTLPLTVWALVVAAELVLVLVLV